MSSKRPPPMEKGNDRAQIESFVSAAREAECDEDPAAWDRRLKAIVKAPAKSPAPKRKPAAKAVRRS